MLPGWASEARLRNSPALVKNDPFLLRDPSSGPVPVQAMITVSLVSVNTSSLTEMSDATTMSSSSWPIL